MCVKRAARGVLAMSRIGHVVAAWRVRHAYRQEFESRAWTATDIFGVRSVSTIMRGEVETRKASVSASETADHAANPSFLAKKNTNLASTL